MAVDRIIRSVYGWACERLYHECAWSYDLVSRVVSAGAWPAWRRLALEEMRGACVLEIGFGTGELLLDMAGRGWQVYGLELSPAMQGIAARRLAGRRLDVPRVQAPAQAMPLADASFTTIVSTFPAPYILSAATLAECWRVLESGGRLVVGGLWVTPDSVRLRRWLPIFYADALPEQRASIEQRFRAVGFVVNWRIAQSGWVQVPLLIAEKPAQDKGPGQDG